MKATAEKLLYTAFLSLCLIVTGCGGGDGGSATAGTDDSDDSSTGDGTCTVAEKKNAVHTLMNDVYYWYDEVPDVNVDNFDDEADLLAALIKPEEDRGHVYSYLTTVAEENAFLNNAAYYGFGISLAYGSTGEFYIREVFEGGPADAVGFMRGDLITELDGDDVSTMTAYEFNQRLGPSEEGYEVVFTVEHPLGGTQTEKLAKAEVESTVVGKVVTDLPSADATDDTTYIFFRSFVNPAFEELDAAFADMKAAGDTKLVLDLRYNGGGLISVAQHLGSLIGGVRFDGEVIAELEFNDRYSSENEAYLIETLSNSVDVTDLVVITTGGTASASEMIINGMEPFINVHTVGSQSYGKPVGQSRLDFDYVEEDCTDDILRGVTFKVVNKDGAGEYYEGFPPTCAATDDIFHALGDRNEASLQEALNILDGTGCTTASVKAMQAQAKMMSLQPDGDPFIRDGWDLLIGGAK